MIKRSQRNVLEAGPGGERLPLPIRFAIVAALTLLNSVVYLALNSRPLDFATQLYPTRLDRLVGWHAGAIWPYWLLLTLAPMLALGISRRPVLARTLSAYAVALTLNALIWATYPTWLAREALPNGLAPATWKAWQLLLALDRPGNCFPSGHVTLPVVIAIGFGLEHRRLRLPVAAVIVTLLPSVIATGQHTAWDAAAGLATAAAGWACTYLRRRPAFDPRWTRP